MRPISIPRLELQAATLSVKIYRVLMDELTYEISKATFWSDSQTTLQYIKNETKRFQTGKSVKLLRQTNGGIARERLILLMMLREG